MEHTKGPWRVVEQRIPHYMGGEHVVRTIYTGWDHPQMKGPLPVVCVAIGVPEKQGQKAIEFCSIEAGNAALIAAAPELLESLREVVAISDRKHDAWDRAKAAIAKATGAA